MFETAKVGDQVWSFDRGWGVITGIESNQNLPLTVKFDNGSEHTRSYGYDGKLGLDDLHPTLLWDEVTFTIPPKRIVDYKLINGVKVPNISFTPAPNREYYYPSVDKGAAGVLVTFYDVEDNVDTFRSDAGLCYPYSNEGKLAAMAHAKAMMIYEIVE
jgi:hypothetical protein